MRKLFNVFNYFVLIILLLPFYCYAQTDFTVFQCQSEEEAIAIVDSVLLYNVNPIFKKNISITGDPGAIGYYTNGYIFGFASYSGVILSSGFAGSLDNSNNCSGFESGNNGGGDDPDLSQISGTAINDAIVIEFDLMLFNDSVYLSYIFGSEEYHEWVSPLFSDVFGFFVSGPGINGPYTNNAVNIAVVPGTDSYVSIQNINCGDEDSFCNPPPGNGPNCELLYDNSNSTQNSFNQCTLDAYTLPLKTEQQIQSYEWYHFKLAIGDAVDAAYDSGVMLEKGSIVSIPVPEFNLVESESESDAIHFIDTVLLSKVHSANKANISYVGDPKAFGYFSNTEFLNLDQDNGLLITSGIAGDATQTNKCNSTANASSNNDGLENDEDLAILSSNIELNDISIIEFDYRPSTDTLNFNYVFASEEYHEMIGVGYNDVFGIFLSGPGIDGEFSNDAVNIATISDEYLPVSSSTINYGLGSLTCEEKPDDCLNCELLIDNSQKTDFAFFAMAYDGYTIPLNAAYPVTAGEWYHIKIAICDALTETFDSGIFLAEGTLVSDSLVTLINHNSFAENIHIRPNPAKDYIVVQNNSEQTIIEYSIYDLSGRLLVQQAFSSEISLGNIQTGILVIELITDHQIIRQKLIHQ